MCTLKFDALKPESTINVFRISFRCKMLEGFTRFFDRSSKLMFLIVEIRLEKRLIPDRTVSWFELVHLTRNNCDFCQSPIESLCHRFCFRLIAIPIQKLSFPVQRVIDPTKDLCLGLSICIAAGDGFSIVKDLWCDFASFV